MENKQGFIRYQSRSKTNPHIEYATFCIPKWIDKGKRNIETWLGRVINKDDRIFFTKELTYYKFTEDNKVLELSQEDSLHYASQDIAANTRKGNSFNLESDESQKILNFGDSFVIDSFIKNDPIKSIFDFDTPIDLDSLFSLILFRISSDKAYSYAERWWETNYCKFLYPNADLRSQKISQYLTVLGSEHCFMSFFKNYLSIFHNVDSDYNILLDSTELPNNIKCPLTAFSNHNGIKSNQIMLITLFDRITNLPIYYRYVPGNIVDVSTLQYIIEEIYSYGINIKRLILDDGYYSEDNITQLVNLNIDFITRMVYHPGLYDQLLERHIPKIQNVSNFVEYGERRLFISKENVTYFESQIPLYAYICLDLQTHEIESIAYFQKFNPKTDTNEKMNKDLLRHGVFIMVSNLNLNINEILPFYYSRQSVEQFFDYIKNDIDVQPLRIHSLSTFSGHMFLSFIATILYMTINNKLINKKLSLSKSLFYLQNLHCHVYDKYLITDVKNKYINQTLKALKINIPTKIKIKS
jgi:hypothetical protein